MPCSNQSPRVKIGQFQAILVKHLKKKEKPSFEVSPYASWSSCTDFSFGRALSAVCVLFLLIAAIRVSVCLQSTASGNIVHSITDNGMYVGKLDSMCGSLFHCTSIVSVTSWEYNTVLCFFEAGEGLKYSCISPGMFLLLSGDVESNPGPDTETLIKELGKSLSVRMDKMSSEIHTVVTSLATMTQQIKELSDQMVRKQKDIDDLQARTNSIEGRLSEIENKLEKQKTCEPRSREKNLVVNGIPESESTDESPFECADALVNAINRHDAHNRWVKDDIDDVHRLGQKKETETDRPRPLLVKLMRKKDKRFLMTNRDLRQALKADGITYRDDLTLQQRETLKSLRSEGRVAYYRGSKLVTRDKRPTETADVDDSNHRDELHKTVQS